ncbi:MAG: DUF4382 domain-containing protein [Chloroflexi bacterium]|nr:DUF4382 domain-containing protein [Chloroflexota bacterium]
MKIRNTLGLIVLAVVSLLALVFSAVSAQDADTGSLAFRANGEDFVRAGFVSKDGWAISFENVFVHLAEIRAYQTTPPYNPDNGELTRSSAMIGLPGTYTVDLAAGDENAETLFVGDVADAPAGFFNALAWTMTPAAEGDAAGYSLVIAGTATRDDATIDFTIRVAEEYNYTCGAFIGDERKGIVQAGETADVELTFHFDHIFGDAELPADDGLNTSAPGFDPFAALAEDGIVDVALVGLADVMPEADYQLLVDILPTLGHTGEGHCYES